MPESPWKPFATAPKDGTTFLVYDGKEVYSGSYRPEWPEEKDPWLVFLPSVLPSHGCGCCRSKDPEPLWWTEIPEPPESP